MGKLNVTMLRYLTREDFRVLTAVSIQINLKIAEVNALKNFRLKWV